MKKTNILLSFLISSVLSFSSVFAAGIDHFKVELSPDTAEVGEALDLIIEAVDKNNNSVKDYDGTILIFSESDPEAELPSALEDNTYTYKLSDEGVIKFENAIKFKNGGTQNINVYDLNDDTIFGIGEVEITKSVKQQNIDIEIISPEDGLTIGKNNIQISGTTKKNYKVKITLNNKEEFSTTTNNDGIFEKEITNLIDGENSIKAEVLDADGNIIGESNIVKIKVNDNNLDIKNIKITPETVDPENSFEIEVIANPKLNKVQAIINDTVNILTETKDGVYSAKLYAPKKPGTYKIDIKITDELGHDKTEIGSASIKVNKIELKAAEEKKVEKKIENKIDKELKITGLKLVELKTKSILSWNPVNGAESYNIYKKTNSGSLELITNIKKTHFEVIMSDKKESYDYFAVKAVGKTNSGEIYEGNLSDATKIKTGPELLILFLISLLVGGFLIIKGKKA